MGAAETSVGGDCIDIFGEKACAAAGCEWSGYYCYGTEPVKHKQFTGIGRSTLGSEQAVGLSTEIYCQRYCAGSPNSNCQNSCESRFTEGTVAFSKAEASNVSVFVQGFAVFGLGIVLYGAYKHYSK